MNNKPNLGNSISKMFQTNIKNPKTTEDIYDSNKNIESIIGETTQDKPSVGEPSEISLDKTDNSSILNNNKNAFGGFGWFSISIIVIIILILIVVLYLYINKENNLNIQDFFSNTYNNILSWFGYKTEQSVISSKGQDINKDTDKDEDKDADKDDKLNKILKSDKDNNYNADDSYSSIQGSKSTNKSGWCYIGEDRGFRTCAFVNEDDTCMSGDIFPSKDICINPNLRL